MKTCPHCGAPLGEHARFCTHCMTPLNQKRVIPTPTYFPVRWLSATVAVFVLCGTIWGGLQWKPQGEQAVIAPTTGAQTTVTTTEGTTLTTTAEGIPLTTLAESFGTHPTDTATTVDAVTTTTTDPFHRLPSFRTTTATTGSTTTLKTTQTTTTTTTRKTTTTAPAPTYPEEWDGVYRSTTEDDIPIEEVTWTYKAAGDKLSLYYSYELYELGPTSSVSRSYTKTKRYGIPMSECIILTGFDAPTENGIYRIPAAIDGKVVVGVDMRTAVEGACQFNDAAIAPTVKRLYLPPELLMIERNTINQCSALEGIYFGCDTIWLEPKALPSVGRNVNMYSYTYCYMSCATVPYDLPLLKEYCGGGITHGQYGYYKQATWQLSSFAWLDLYGYRW